MAWWDEFVDDEYNLIRGDTARQSLGAAGEWPAVDNFASDPQEWWAPQQINTDAGAQQLAPSMRPALPETYQSPIVQQPEGQFTPTEEQFAQAVDVALPIVQRFVGAVPTLARQFQQLAQTPNPQQTDPFASDFASEDYWRARQDMGEQLGPSNEPAGPADPRVASIRATTPEQAADFEARGWTPRGDGTFYQFLPPEEPETGHGALHNLKWAPWDISKGIVQGVGRVADATEIPFASDVTDVAGEGLGYAAFPWAGEGGPQNQRQLATDIGRGAASVAIPQNAVDAILMGGAGALRFADDISRGASKADALRSAILEGTFMAPGGGPDNVAAFADEALPALPRRPLRQLLNPGEAPAASRAGRAERATQQGPRLAAVAGGADETLPQIRTVTNAAGEAVEQVYQPSTDTWINIKGGGAVPAEAVPPAPAPAPSAGPSLEEMASLRVEGAPELDAALAAARGAPAPAAPRTSTTTQAVNGQATRTRTRTVNGETINQVFDEGTKRWVKAPPRPPEPVNALPTDIPKGTMKNVPEELPGSVRRRTVTKNGKEVNQVFDAAKKRWADEATFAGNIRLSKFPDEARDLVKAAADANPDGIQAARRGVRSDAQVREDAQALVDEMGGNFEKIKKSWKPGDAWNAEEIVAIRGALTGATQKVWDAAQAARAAPGSVIQHRAVVEALLEDLHVQSIVGGVAAESGRSLRAFRQAADAAMASDDVLKMQALLKQAIGKGGRDVDIDALAKAITALDINNPAAVQDFLRNINKPDFWDKLEYYWKNSILSGPVTQAKGIMGNLSTALAQPVRLGYGAAIEQPLAKLAGRPAERFWQEAPASVVGMLMGIPEGGGKFLRTLKDGISPTQAAKLDVRSAPIGGWQGRLIGAPMTLLSAADEMSHAINARGFQWADAQRVARRKGLKGQALQDEIARLIANPTDAMVRRREAMADKNVFRNDPGGGATALSNLRQRWPVLKYVLPFVATPTNLVKTGLEYSPAGLFNYRAWKRAWKGDPDDLAKSFMGATVAATLGAGVANGTLDLTAAEPVDREERDRFFREGKRPYSVKIPGIGWVEYKNIPVLDTTFTGMAVATDAIRRGEDASGIAAQVAASIGSSLMDKTYVSGMSDFLDVVRDPGRHAERYATRMGLSFTPASSGFRQVAGMLDTTVRQPQGFVESAKANLPFLSESVPPRLNAFGEPAKRPGALAQLSLLNVSADQQSAVDAELERLGIEQGFTGKTINAVNLSRDQKQLFQEMAGKVNYLLLADTIQQPEYQALKPEEQIKVIDELRNSARDSITEPVGAALKALASPEFAALPKDFQSQVLDAVKEAVPPQLWPLVEAR